MGRIRGYVKLRGYENEVKLENSQLSYGIRFCHMFVRANVQAKEITVISGSNRIPPRNDLQLHEREL